MLTVLTVSFGYCTELTVELMFSIVSISSASKFILRNILRLLVLILVSSVISWLFSNGLGLFVLLYVITHERLCQTNGSNYDFNLLFDRSIYLQTSLVF